ncbi:MAG: hypothetical protein PWR14_794 [Thermosediminibacterales bacterium]|nr:hypothetical protein [Thermosediminibacterales bacterium]
MQQKSKIYLEISVISHLQANDASDKQRITKNFWGAVAKNRFFEIWLSDLVLMELAQCPNPKKREKFFEYMGNIRYNNIVLDNNIIELAYRYIKRGAFTKRHIFDALHVAAASIGSCDVLVSWDMRHIVREKTILGVNEVNCSEGLDLIKITTPQNFKGGYDENP